MARDYNEYAWHFRVLADAQREGKLVFVLGSGIGRPHGLPDWSQLLAELLIDSGRLPRFVRRKFPADADREDTEAKEKGAVVALLQHLASDPLLQGAIAHAAYPGARWRAALDAKLGVQRLKTIEGGASGNAISSVAHRIPNAPIVRIARMLARALETHVHRHISVLTFNYDSLLDDAVRHELTERGLEPSLLRSVSAEIDFERTWLDAGIYIYHLHGYLGVANPGQQNAADAILDADSYVPVLRGDHWSWRCMERALTAAGYASLFIGLSITDPSLRYVLSRWGQWQTPLMGVYLAPPPKLPAFGYRFDSHTLHYADDARTLALIYRVLMDLYSAVLDHLHLVCYHLSSWNEISDILEQIERPS